MSNACHCRQTPKPHLNLYSPRGTVGRPPQSTTPDAYGHDDDYDDDDDDADWHDKDYEAVYREPAVDCGMKSFRCRSLHEALCISTRLCRLNCDSE